MSGVKFADIPVESYHFIALFKNGKRGVTSTNDRNTAPAFNLGLLALTTSPGGRKKFAELTEEGKKHLPLIEEALAERRRISAERTKAQEVLDLRRLAGPALYDALKKARADVADYDEHTASPAREREIKMLLDEIDAALRLADEGGTGETL